MTVSISTWTTVSNLMSSVHSSNSGEQAISVRNPGRSPAPNRCATVLCPSLSQHIARLKITMPNTLARVAAILFAAGTLASATTFIVGDDQGWTIGVDYIAWVRGKTFKVGDKLGEYVVISLLP